MAVLYRDKLNNQRSEDSTQDTNTNPGVLLEGCMAARSWLDRPKPQKQEKGMHWMGNCTTNHGIESKGNNKGKRQPSPHATENAGQLSGKSTYTNGIQKTITNPCADPLHSQEYGTKCQRNHLLPSLGLQRKAGFRQKT
jgi:hypothetical protein